MVSRLQMSNIARAAIVAFATFAMVVPSRADYPEQPVKVIVPFPAGSYPDVVTRLFTHAFAKKFGKPFIIENKTGAGGRVGEDAVATSPADGYTLLVSGVTRSVFLQAADPTVKEDRVFLRDFSVIGALNQSPIVFAISPTLGVKDFQAVMNKIKVEPRKHAYASPGAGTPSHIRSAEIVKMFGLDVEHVPYRGETNALADLSQGVIAWMIDTPIAVQPMSEAGKVVPVFVVSPNRLPTMPNVPTFGELGYPMFDRELSGMFLSAPAGTPTKVLETLNAALNEALKDPEIIAALEARGQILPPADMNLDRVRKMAGDKIEGAERSIKAISQ